MAEDPQSRTLSLTENETANKSSLAQSLVLEDLNFDHLMEPRNQQNSEREENRKDSAKVSEQTQKKQMTLNKIFKQPTVKSPSSATKSSQNFNLKKNDQVIEGVDERNKSRLNNSSDNFLELLKVKKGMIVQINKEKNPDSDETCPENIKSKNSLLPKSEETDSKKSIKKERKNKISLIPEEENDLDLKGVREGISDSKSTPNICLSPTKEDRTRPRLNSGPIKKLTLISKFNKTTGRIGGSLQRSDKSKDGYLFSVDKYLRSTINSSRKENSLGFRDILKKESSTKVKIKPGRTTKIGWTSSRKGGKLFTSTSPCTGGESSTGKKYCLSPDQNLYKKASKGIKERPWQTTRESRTEKLNRYKVGNNRFKSPIHSTQKDQKQDIKSAKNSQKKGLIYYFKKSAGITLNTKDNNNIQDCYRKGSESFERHKMTTKRSTPILKTFPKILRKKSSFCNNNRAKKSLIKSYRADLRYSFKDKEKEGAMVLEVKSGCLDRVNRMSKGLSTRTGRKVEEKLKKHLKNDFVFKRKSKPNYEMRVKKDSLNRLKNTKRCPKNTTKSHQDHKNGFFNRSKNNSFRSELRSERSSLLSEGVKFNSRIGLLSPEYGKKTIDVKKTISILKDFLVNKADGSGQRSSRKSSSSYRVDFQSNQKLFKKTQKGIKKRKGIAKKE